MLTRRAALKAGAGAVAGGAVLSGSDVGPLDLDGVSPTGEAEAVPPVVVAFGVAAATSWTLDEIGVFGSNDPPDGLGPDTLQTQIYQAAVKRKSVNQSTFVDQQNLIKFIPEAAFSKGKLAALDAIKNGATESEAINRGQSAANSHFATIEENLLKSWNESLTELENFISSVKSHSTLTLSNVMQIVDTTDSRSADPNVAAASDVTLRDGSTFGVKSIQGNGDTEVPYPDNPVNPATDYDVSAIEVTSIDGNTVRYLMTDPNVGDQWHGVWTSMQSTFDDVLNNISVWVSNTYSGIQSGELSPDEYLSATDFANTIAADADQAAALGNLLALNIPGEYENEMTVEFSDGSVYQGFLATTDDTNVPKLTAGTSINPDATDDNGNALYETWYLAYRPGSYIEPIDSYDDAYGIQGGTMRFTSDPTTASDGQTLGDSIEYVVETSKGEQATIVPSDLTQETIDSTTYWTVDLSSQLDETIAEINRVRRVYAGEQPDTYRTMTVNQPFTITAIDGADSVQIQQHREPQTDDNYVSDEEWQQMNDKVDELIKRYEDAKNSGIAIPGLSDLTGLPTIPGLNLIESGIVVGLGILGLNAATS